MTQTTPHKPTYAIIHGLAEGLLHSRRLRHAFEAQGFRRTKPTDADIVITHSAGSLVAPAGPKLFVHINVSYWPGKPLLRSVREIVAYDYRLSRQRKRTIQWLMGLCANLLYLSNIIRGLQMRKPFYQGTKTLAQLPAAAHVFIRNHNDSYCDPAALLDATDTKHTYITLPGNHNDCWRDPEAYVGVVQSLYARVLAETNGR